MKGKWVYQTRGDGDKIVEGNEGTISVAREDAKRFRAQDEITTVTIYRGKNIERAIMIPYTVWTWARTSMGPYGWHKEICK